MLEAAPPLCETLARGQAALRALREDRHRLQSALALLECGEATATLIVHPREGGQATVATGLAAGGAARARLAGLLRAELAEAETLLPALAQIFEGR